MMKEEEAEVEVDPMQMCFVVVLRKLAD